MTNYYNENDPAAAHCIRALIADGVIAPGDVDERSIIEVKPDDVRGYTQCHFFAGGSVWQLALRQAGWPDDRPVWTGSPPCQPYSVAGKQLGEEDPRDLWDDLFRLINAERPPIVFGEQVSAAAKGRKRVSNHMQQMLNFEALRGVLSGQREKLQLDWLQALLQGMREGNVSSEQTQEWFEATTCGFLQEISQEKQGEGLDFVYPASSQESQFEFRSGRLQPRDSRSNRQGCLRDDRDTLFSGLDQQGWGELGRSIDRPNRAGTGIHDNQYSGNYLCSKCDDEHLGRGEGVGSVRGSEETQKPESVRGLGEETDQKPIRNWLDRICDDLERVGYTTGAADIAACAVDAPHQRSRLYWYAKVDDARHPQWGKKDNGRRIKNREKGERNKGSDSIGKPTGIDAMARSNQLNGRVGAGGSNRAKAGNAHGCELADTNNSRSYRTQTDSTEQSCDGTQSGLHQRDIGREHENVGNTINPRLERHTRYGNEIGESQQDRSVPETDGSTSYWGNHWIECYDGKARRTEPSIFFLADGISLPVDAIGSEGAADVQEAFPKNRIEAWRIAGNAIVPQLAVEFIKSVAN